MSDIRYDKITIVLHWLTALLVVEQWVGAQLIDLFPRGPARVDARSVHIVLGALTALVLAVRLAWRLTRGRRLPPVGTGLVVVMARLAHLLLYVLLAAMVLVGLVLEWARGDSLFTLLTIPAYDPGNRALVHSLEELHGSIGWVIVAAVALHVAAALAHRFLWRDGVMDRMALRTTPPRA